MQAIARMRVALDEMPCWAVSSTNIPLHQWLLTRRRASLQGRFQHSLPGESAWKTSRDRGGEASATRHGCISMRSLVQHEQAIDVRKSMLESQGALSVTHRPTVNDVRLVLEPGVEPKPH